MLTTESHFKADPKAGLHYLTDWFVGEQGTRRRQQKSTKHLQKTQTRLIGIRMSWFS